MESLHEIFSRCRSILAIDSASLEIQVGLLRPDREPLWEASHNEANTGIFEASAALLARGGLTLDEVEAFLFCEGPGSILGIRTAATALRIWSMVRTRPLYAFGSLDLVARYQLHTGAARPFSVIADARRDSWHVVSASASGSVNQLQRATTETLSGFLVMPVNFRHWAPLPAGVCLVPYSIATMFAALADLPIFRATTEPDAFLHEQPVYQTWTPRIHRAPS